MRRSPRILPPQGRHDDFDEGALLHTLCLRPKALTPKRLQTRADKLKSDTKELTELWRKASQDELAVQPAQCVADILIISGDYYVELVALQAACTKQLRQFYTLCTDAEQARRAAEDRDSEFPTLGKRRWVTGGSDSANSATSTPRSAASTPAGGSSSRPSRPRLPPPEDSDLEEDEARVLGVAADSEAVPVHLRGNGPAAAAHGAGMDSQRERRCCLQAGTWS